MKFIVIGHSHILTVREGLKKRVDPANTFEFLLLRAEQYRKANDALSEDDAKNAASDLSGINKEAVIQAIRDNPADVALLSLNGNESAGLGLLANKAVPHEAKLKRVREFVERRLAEWFDFLLPMLPKRVLFFPPPAPLSESGFAGAIAARFGAAKLEPYAFRMAAWKFHCDVTREVCERHGVQFVEVPPETLDANGFRLPQFATQEPFHGNEAYGALLVQRLVAAAEQPPAAQGRPSAPAAAPASRPAASHPYAALPDHSFWKQSISRLAQADVDPLVDPPFQLARTDRVATAGSCFAQHISRRLQANGYDFMVVEEAPPPPAGAAADEENATFSARYGNIYTARQLLQLFERAFGFFRPLENHWEKNGGGYCDPFRPRIEANGFPTVEALLADQERHLAAVRRMFTELDVLVFTLGLTEAWYSRLDGAVYPVAPGVVGGTFDPAKHAFVNFSVQEVVADMSKFIDRLALVNKKASIILTVSPVPLVATATGGHVLTSTVYSKSVLRVAAEELRRQHTHVCYFPSYEIITGPHTAASYFTGDRRTVAEQGVDHVMRIFMKRMTAGAAEAPQQAAAPAPSESSQAMEQMDAAAEVFCDEEMLERRDAADVEPPPAAPADGGASKGRWPRLLKGFKPGKSRHLEG